MRNIISGLAVLGFLATGTIAIARPMPLSPAGLHQPNIQRVDWDNCGPRCQEHRREAREQERHRWSQHRRAEEHRRWEESRYPPPPTHGYQHRYGG